MKHKLVIAIAGLWVAAVVALAGAVPAGAAPLPEHFKIASQGGDHQHLFTLTSSGLVDTRLGMNAGTSPSINMWGEVAFQANTGELWKYDAGGGGDDTRLGMKAGTSPSINWWGDVAFQADTGHLWVWSSTFREGRDLHLGMRAGTSPSINDHGATAFQADTGHLWAIGEGSCRCDTQQLMGRFTSPSLNNTGDIAYQGTNGYLKVTGSFGIYESRLWMMAGTSPSITP